MNEYIKKIVNNSVVYNGLWLMILQGVNTILPMITIPYITRILGAEGYGIFSAAQNWIFYLQVIVEYGFGLWGARKVALIKDDDTEEISEIFSEILNARIILCILSFILMCTISAIANISIDRFICQIILYAMIIGSMLQLIWLFQGKENMKPITIINIISRIISVLLIFIFVKNKSDIYAYTFFYSITYIISALLTIRVAKKKYNIRYIHVGIGSIFTVLKEAWYIFLSSALIKVFSGIALSILTIVSSNYYIGVYSAIYKIPYILVMAFSPISQALYPSISKKYKSSFNEGVKFVEKITLPIVALFTIISTVIILLKDIIVKIAFGSEYVLYSSIIFFLLIQTIFAIYNNFLGVQTLVASGNQKNYSRAFSRAAIFMGSIYLLVFILFDGEKALYAVSIGSAISESILTIFLHIEKKLVLKKYLICKE